MGTIGYLSAMKHSSFLLGNTSSGIIEASFFPKWVINLGERQTGRYMGENIIKCDYEKKQIYNALNKVLSLSLPTVKPIYGKGKTSIKIFRILQRITNL